MQDWLIPDTTLKTSFCWAYYNVPLKIIAEEYIPELENTESDYKFFCFNGNPEFIYVSNDLVHDRQAQIGFFYLDGTKMPLIRDDYAPMDIDQLPDFFEDMKKAAEMLCKAYTRYGWRLRYLRIRHAIGNTVIGSVWRKMRDL